MGLFDRLKNALVKTRDKVVTSFKPVLPFGRKIDEALLDNVRARGAQLAAASAGLPGVESVRGRGLLLGIEVAAAAEIVDAARTQGLLVLTAGENVVRLAPPLTVTADEVDDALQIFDRIFC